LKENFKKRRRKEEILRYNQEKEEELRHIRYLLDNEAALGDKRFKIEQPCNVTNSNNNMDIQFKEKTSGHDCDSAKSVQV